MSKVLVDTNILLRLILQDDAAGLRASRALLASSGPADCRVTPLVVSEVLYVLKVLGFDREHSATTLLMILAFDQFGCDDHITEAVQLFRTHNLDFVDCFLIIVALRERSDLVTLDKKAAKIYNRLREEV
jgi:predicted nucleic-acid-binding protein